ncbi:MAG: prephenate dehydrogenase/arogenate dehydrogenase family protein, partial [Gemmatimonadaceae bacterium]
MSGDVALDGVSTVAVLGLGLIGGSVARDLAGQRRDIRVIAYDRDASSLQSAHEAGAVTRVMDAGLHQVVEADIVVLATPV